MSDRPMPPGVELAFTTAALPLAGVAVIIFLAGLGGLLRERGSTVTWSFFLLTLSASVWLGAAAAMISSPGAFSALFWARLTYVGVCAIPAALLQFTFALCEQTARRRAITGGAWLASALFTLLFVTNDAFIVGVVRYDWGWYALLGRGSMWFLLYLAFALVSTVSILVESSRGDVTEQQKKRLTSFLLALACGYFGTVDLLPSFGVAIYPAGCLGILGFVALSVRTIRRYRFVDLNPLFVADQLLETVEGGVLVVDTRGTIRLANAGAATMLGTTIEALTGSALNAVVGTRALPATDSPTFMRLGRTRNRPDVWTRADGSKVEVSFSATMLRDREQLPVGILYVMQDLSERRRAEQHEFAAHHDPLTGVPNRAWFAAQFEQVVPDILASGRIAAVMFLDLDGFKQINDEHGHGVGDHLLQVIAARLRNGLRAEDLFARYGGDEFVVLVSLRAAEDAAIVARKLIAVARDPVAVDHKTLRVGASIGIARCPGDGSDLQTLIHVADEEMYRQKRAVRSAPPRDRAAVSPVSAEGRA